MVKVVQAEDGVAGHFDGLLKARVAAEVGLLIGKPSVGSRDIVLAVVPHPEGDEVLSVTSSGAAAPAAASKAKKGSSSAAVRVSIRHEDVADHALQVTRMLPGGISVLGLYLFSPDSGFSSASSTLCKTLCNVATDLAALSGGITTTTSSSGSSSSGSKGAAAADEQQQELLLLHVDSATKKFSMKSCLVSSGEHAAAASLKPCELKFGPSLSSLVCLRTQHTFDLSLPAKASSAQLQQLLRDAVAQEAARVASGIALVAGSIPASSSQPLADLLPPSSSGVTGGGNSISDPVQVQLYCSPSVPTPPPAAATTASGTGSTTGGTESGTAYGSVRLYGTVAGIAYVHRRDAAAKALSEFKQDIGRSLTARLQLLENEAVSAAYEAQQAAAAAGGAGASGAGQGSGKGAVGAAAVAPAHPLLAEAGAAGRTTRGLLRRVLMPWDSLGGIQVCDYLMEGDTAEAAVEQGRHLLGLSSLQASQVVAAEAPAVLVQAGRPGKGAAAAARGSGGAGGCGSAVLAAAAAGAAAAVGVALAYLNLGQ